MVRDREIGAGDMELQGQLVYIGGQKIGIVRSLSRIQIQKVISQQRRLEALDFRFSWWMISQGVLCVTMHVVSIGQQESGIVQVCINLV
ncbi:hypothetical protein SS50377_22926 [Spironucleus salmonicida]|uniref:Uncharacterized protein n=1 Tax=Spironucleus salmonicida TaxID=348837 RepID=V6LYH8_9EUKA|nr:hypothetical protein SS50377_22926 [Spironucleus salmonicida]|eukprot:EST48771.1 Hypothetical protein SS50377_11095 [Spironucleus salmonicida]